MSFTKSARQTLGWRLEAGEDVQVIFNTVDAMEMALAIF